MKITWTDKEITIDGEGTRVVLAPGEKFAPCVDPCPFPLVVTNFVFTDRDAMAARAVEGIGGSTPKP